MLLIACGALAREIVALIEANRWRAFDVQGCLPAIWHNTPSRISRRGFAAFIIRSNKSRYRSIFVLYGDCGTGGLLDKVFPTEVGSSALPGRIAIRPEPAMSASTKRRRRDLTTFFLTDYLARHFDKLIWEGLGIAAPIPSCCRSISATTPGSSILPRPAMKRSPSAPWPRRSKLGLAYEYRYVGYGELEENLRKRA